MEAPALPWATVDTEPAGASEAQLHPLVLAPGERLEIRWLITFNHYEGAEPQTKDVWRWWAATVIGPKVVEGNAPGSQHSSYEILYEAYEAFAAEQTTVKITGPRTLLDERHPDGELLWRRHGDTTVTDDESDEGEECSEVEEEEDGDGLTLDEEGQSYIKQDRLDGKLAATLLTACHNATVASGTSMEELEADTFKQQVLAKACNDMLEGIKTMIERKREGTDAGVVVTREDVQEMFQDLKKQRTG